MSAEQGQGKTALDIALGYITRGWSPIPVCHRSKALDGLADTEMDKWHIDAQTAPTYFNGKPQNVGVVLGALSNNLVDVDLDDPISLRLADILLPPTASVFGRKSNPASHRLYKTTDDPGPIKPFNAGGMLIEYRANGCMTVFPGSVHKETGELIEWVSDGEPRVVERDQLLSWVQTVAVTTLIAKRWTDGNRNNLAKAVIGVMLREGTPATMVESMVSAVCKVTNDPETDERVVMVSKFARQLETNSKAKVPGWPKLKEATDDTFITKFREWTGYDEEVTPGPSDDDLALNFAEKYEGDLRHVAAWGRWLIYTGQYWANDEKLTVFDRARALLRAVRDEITPTLKSAQQARLRARLGAAATIYSVVKLAGNDPRLTVAPSELDADPWSLNTPGAIINLHTGEHRPNSSAELHTKITAATPHDNCTLWLKTLERVVPDKEVRDYLQRVAGYALTGSSREHVLVFLCGRGRNGKGTVVHSIAAMMGNYALHIAAEVLVETHNDRHPTELAQFHGARLVIGSELSEGKRFNESRVKRLTGGDPISARFTGKDNFTFNPTHTLVLLANTKPSLRVVDEAMKARMHLVMFNVFLAEQERDTKLPEKLIAEYGGILQWAINGCLEWQQLGGLRPPKSVIDTTNEYLSSEDNVALWLTECTESTAGTAKLSQLHANYRLWCQMAGVPPLGRNAFCDQLEVVHGHRCTGRGGRAVIFHGVRISGGYVRREEVNA